jgi:hypothetical protein
METNRTSVSTPLAGDEGIDNVFTWFIAGDMNGVLDVICSNIFFVRSTWVEICIELVWFERLNHTITFIRIWLRCIWCNSKYNFAKQDPRGLGEHDNRNPVFSLFIMQTMSSRMSTHELIAVSKTKTPWFAQRQIFERNFLWREWICMDISN